MFTMLFKLLFSLNNRQKKFLVKFLQTALFVEV